MMKLYIIALFAVVALGSPQGYPSFGGQLWENPTQQICAQSGVSDAKLHIWNER